MKRIKVPCKRQRYTIPILLNNNSTQNADQEIFTSGIERIIQNCLFFSLIQLHNIATYYAAKSSKVSS